MKNVNQFIILCFMVACMLISIKSSAQPPPPPSWKFTTTYTGGDSGIYYCITDVGPYVPCAKTGTACASLPSGYEHLWIHLFNRLGADMEATGYTIIKKIELDIESIFPDGGSEYIGVCDPCKNWGIHYLANGFSTPWNVTGVDGYINSTPVSLASPQACKDVSYIGAMTDYTLTFTPPTGGGSCSGTSNTSYDIYPINHFMVSISDNAHKLRLKVHVYNAAGAEYSLSPLIFTDFDHAINHNGCPLCVSCGSTCP